MFKKDLALITFDYDDLVRRSYAVKANSPEPIEFYSGKELPPNPTFNIYGNGKLSFKYHQQSNSVSNSSENYITTSVDIISLTADDNNDRTFILHNNAMRYFFRLKHNKPSRLKSEADKFYDSADPNTHNQHLFKRVGGLFYDLADKIYWNFRGLYINSVISLITDADFDLNQISALHLIDGDKAVCSGDSGSPVTIKVGDKEYLFGIVALGVLNRLFQKRVI